MPRLKCSFVCGLFHPRFSRLSQLLWSATSSGYRRPEHHSLMTVNVVRSSKRHGLTSAITAYLRLLLQLCGQLITAPEGLSTLLFSDNSLDKTCFVWYDVDAVIFRYPLLDPEIACLFRAGAKHLIPDSEPCALDVHGVQFFCPEQTALG